jgi:large exoprotein involved in heme utilization and adhesion
MSGVRLVLEDGELRTNSSGLRSTTSVENGKGGNIHVVAPHIEISDGGRITALSQAGGAAGTIVVEASDTLRTRNGDVTTSSTKGAGAGAITLTAGRLVDLNDGEISTSLREGEGDAGDLTLTAQVVKMSHEARIDSSTRSAGHGGTIRINAGNLLSLSGRASILSNAQDSGPGGDINITAQQLDLRGRSRISASSTGTAQARAGSVDVTFAQAMVLDRSSIATESSRADGGNIAIRSTGSLLQLRNSEITTSVRSGTGAGGTIAIGLQQHPLSFVVLDHSAVLAKAFAGGGGKIGIIADVFLASASNVDVSSVQSTAGTIDIQARITDVSGSLAQLPDDTLQAASLLRASCAARSKASSFVVARREGVPPEPGGLLSSPLSASVLQGADAVRGKNEVQALPTSAGVWSAWNCAQ